MTLAMSFKPDLHLSFLVTRLKKLFNPCLPKRQAGLLWGGKHLAHHVETTDMMNARDFNSLLSLLLFVNSYSLSHPLIAWQNLLGAYSWTKQKSFQLLRSIILWIHWDYIIGHPFFCFVFNYPLSFRWTVNPIFNLFISSIIFFLTLVLAIFSPTT